MTFARILLKLWRLRLWVGLGLVVAGVAAVGSVATSHSTVYATASTQMLVDSPDSALANASVDLSFYDDRASVFARMMTSAAALQYIGQAAGIDGSLIEANGPVEINGSPTATHAPVAIVGGKDMPAPAKYELSFVQNPSIPTVDVYAKAPTTRKAIALANGAVTGFANFVSRLNANDVSQSHRVEVRRLGQATGGVVDGSASKSTALLVFVGIFAVWCFIVLFVTRLRNDLRLAKQGGADDVFGIPVDPFPASATPTVADHLPRFAPADSRNGDTNGDAGVDGKILRRAWASTRVPPRP